MEAIAKIARRAGADETVAPGFQHDHAVLLQHESSVFRGVVFSQIAIVVEAFGLGGVARH